MRGISINQPWASMMAQGYKTIETRGWYTRYRGDLVICSCIYRPRKGELDDADYEMVMRLPFGHALCVVEVFDCLSTSEINALSPPISEQEREFGDYSFGRFGFMTRNRRVIDPPVPVRGFQGIYNLSECIVFQIQKRLKPTSKP